ncbi:MAG: methyltransferase domain-containing protein [Phycisphaerales bacterium]|nr:methyltransferase domain-containing protein [Phycisphaerales bacterium]
MTEFASGEQALTVSEIGCGNGLMGEAMLSSSIASRDFGVELFDAAAAEAEQGLTEVVCGDIESIESPCPEVESDLIIASEVLEHIIDP